MRRGGVLEIKRAQLKSLEGNLAGRERRGGSEEDSTPRRDSKARFLRPTSMVVVRRQKGNNETRLDVGLTKHCCCCQDTFLVIFAYLTLHNDTFGSRSSRRLVLVNKSFFLEGCCLDKSQPESLTLDHLGTLSFTIVIVTCTLITLKVGHSK